MTYPALINGFLINGDEGGDYLEGIELAMAGMPTAMGALVVGGVVAIELGNPKAGPTIAIEGIDLASTETDHVLVFNVNLIFEGLDLATTGSHVARLTINHVGAHALELGDVAVTNGTDVNIALAGLDLARSTFHALQAGTILPGNATLQTISARPMELGAIALAPGQMTVTAGGGLPMEVGMPGTRIGLLASSTHAMEMGDPGPVRIAITAGGASALQLGSPSTIMSISIEGIDLARASQHSVRTAGITLQDIGGMHALELGEPGQATRSIRAHQYFPLELGTHAIARGNAC